MTLREFLRCLSIFLEPELELCEPTPVRVLRESQR